MLLDPSPEIAALTAWWASLPNPQGTDLAWLEGAAWALSAVTGAPAAEIVAAVRPVAPAPPPVMGPGSAAAPVVIPGGAAAAGPVAAGAPGAPAPRIWATPMGVAMPVLREAVALREVMPDDPVAPPVSGSMAEQWAGVMHSDDPAVQPLTPEELAEVDAQMAAARAMTPAAPRASWDEAPAAPPAPAEEASA